MDAFAFSLGGLYCGVGLGDGVSTDEAAPTFDPRFSGEPEANGFCGSRRLGIRGGDWQSGAGGQAVGGNIFEGGE